VYAHYSKMVEEGILLNDAGPFDELMKKCSALEARAHQV
jgi:hypothetical protein